MKHSFVLAVLVIGLRGSGAALAASPGDAERARSLADAARQSMASERFEEACAQLTESQRLSASAETLLSLGQCLEARGHIATASLRYRQVLQSVKDTPQSELARVAAERIAALRSQLPRVTLRVSGEPALGEEVRFAGELLGAPAWGTPFTVDPGEYELVASAPGKASWRERIVIAVGEQREIRIPVLGPSAAPVATSVGGPSSVSPPGVAASPPPAPFVVMTNGTPTVEDSGSWSRRHTALVAGGLGLLSFGAGTFFGLRALSKRQDSDELCPTDTTCTGNGQSLNEQAQAAARIADVSIALGLIGAGLGTYLWLSGGSVASEGARVQLGAQLGKAGGQLAVGGVW